MIEPDVTAADWDRRLTAMAAQADEWSERTNNAPRTNVNSALGGDDVPGLHVSGIAWYAMVVAVEHLEFTFRAMRATGTVYPTAQMTALRSALLTASQAVWILAPRPRLDRRSHAMRLQMQDLSDELAMVRGLSELSPDQSTAVYETVAKLEDRKARLKDLSAELALRPSATARLNNTDIVASAARFVHADGEKTLTSGVPLLWRIGSAAAHGQRSYAITRASRNIRRADGAQTIVELRGDVARDIGPSAGAAVLTVAAAFQLFDLRNSGSH